MGIEIIGPIAVRESFATGIFAPEDNGGFVRIVAYADRLIPGTETTARTIVGGLVFTKEDFWQAQALIWRTMMPSLDLTLLRLIAERMMSN